MRDGRGAPVIESHTFLPKVRSPDLMAAIRGMPCELRLASFAGKSCAGRDTVVGCHVGSLGKGMGTKVSDLSVAAGCHLCHDLIDGRNAEGLRLAAAYPAAWSLQILRAVMATQARLVGEGIITVSGGEII